MCYTNSATTTDPKYSHSYLLQTSQDRVACEAAFPCGPVHNTWLAPPVTMHATEKGPQKNHELLRSLHWSHTLIRKESCCLPAVGRLQLPSAAISHILEARSKIFLEILILLTSNSLRKCKLGRRKVNILIKIQPLTLHMVFRNNQLHTSDLGKPMKESST